LPEATQQAGSLMPGLSPPSPPSATLRGRIASGGRDQVLSQPRQIVHETLSRKTHHTHTHTHTQIQLGGVAQGVGLESKPQHCKRKKKKKKNWQTERPAMEMVLRWTPTPTTGPWRTVKRRAGGQRAKPAQVHGPVAELRC
jgi:hypothetical protein